MTIVGGLDVYRQQITVEYVDSDGVVHWVRSVRQHGRRCGAGWSSTALMVMAISRWRAAPRDGMSARSWRPLTWACIWGIRPRSRHCGTRRSAPRPLRCAAVAGGPVPRVVDSASARAGDPQPGPVVLHARTSGGLAAAHHLRPVVPPGRAHRYERCCRRGAARRSRMPSCRRPVAGMWIRRCGVMT
jgi:hypothetical protein